MSLPTLSTLFSRRTSGRWSRLSLALAGHAALPSVACSDEAGVVAGADAGVGSPDAGQSFSSAPDLLRPVNLADGALARAALQLLGSGAVDSDGSCRNCHSLGRPTLTRWSKLTQELSEACLSNPSLSTSAEVDAMLDCFRRQADGAETFSASDFGIYSAAAHLPWFEFLFEQSSELGADDYARFVSRGVRPRAGQQWTQAEFDRVAEWFARGTPELFELVEADPGESCSESLAPRLEQHLDEMAVAGWRARNEQVPLLMFGCRDDEFGADCLSDFPLAEDQDFASGWSVEGTSIRILHDNSDTVSTYWSRTSADGRYIASGLLDSNDSELSGQIVDLQAGRVIEANFDYDPTFFPDNSGFLLQQGNGASGATPGQPSDGSADDDDVALLCEQSVLSDDARITGREDECVELGGQIGLYQQLATSLDGSDYWVVHGSYESDDGGFKPVRANPSAAFEESSRATLTPMINRGDRFEAVAPIRLPTPHQGDPMLSPSGRLLITRVKGDEVRSDESGFDLVTAEQSGYALYQVSLTRDGDEWSATLDDLGRICLQGGKAVFSFDERWLVLHHYVTADDAGELGFDGADDPEFSEYAELGAANLYLVDLRSGAVRRITDMLPGQYALFPNFRSDGWIYFVVRTLDGEEFFAASDAALIFEDE